MKEGRHLRLLGCPDIFLRCLLYDVTINLSYVNVPKDFFVLSRIAVGSGYRLKGNGNKALALIIEYP